jgi:hypothetical protein
MLQATTSIASPYSDDFVYVETSDALTQATDYFILRVSTGTLIPKGAVPIPVQFFPVLPRPDLASRQAWAHPDGESLVAVPLVDASLSAWNPATGSGAARTAIQGGGPPTSLAYDDVTGFFYAREADGGWTVFSVGSQRGEEPVEVLKVADATGVDSLRVVGNGAFLAGTATSSLAVIDANSGGGTVHTVVDTVPLDLDPAGGPLFPQPGANGGAARTFVTVAGPGSGPGIVLPLPGSEFCADDAPPEFEVPPGTGGVRYEIELGTQYDFLPVRGSLRTRFRVPEGAVTATPGRLQWRRILRGAAGPVARPFYARVVAISRTGFRTEGTTASYRVCAPTEPVLAAPADAASVTVATPPTFTFDPGQEGTAWIVLGPDDPDARPRLFARVRVRYDGTGPVSADLPDRVWERVVRRAKKAAGGTLPAPVQWNVEIRDGLRRRVASSAPRFFTVNP